MQSYCPSCGRGRFVKRFLAFYHRRTGLIPALLRKSVLAAAWGAFLVVCYLVFVIALGVLPVAQP